MGTTPRTKPHLLLLLLTMVLISTPGKRAHVDSEGIVILSNHSYELVVIMQIIAFMSLLKISHLWILPDLEG